MVWTYACASADVEEGRHLVLDVGGRRVLLTRVAGRVRALQGRCSHQGADFALSGALDGGRLRCRMHGATFDVANGIRTGGPARDLEVFGVEEKDGRILIDV